MRIITYNVNGIRAAMNKGLVEWVKAAQPDVLCFQETKATPDQVDVKLFEELGYHLYWYSAQKKGYSGVAIFSKLKPKHVEYGCGIEKYDFEGRIIRLDFEHCSVMSVYHPSGSSGDDRQAFKMQWLADFQQYINELKTKLPATKTSAPASINCFPVSKFTPPSTSIKALEPDLIIKSLVCFTLLIVF